MKKITLNSILIISFWIFLIYLSIELSGCSPIEYESEPEYVVDTGSICTRMEEDGSYRKCLLIIDTTYNFGVHGRYSTVPDTTEILLDYTRNSSNPDTMIIKD